MEDYEDTNRKAKLIPMQQIIRDPDTETEQLAKRLEKLQGSDTPENTSLSPQKCSKQKQQTLYEENNTPPENQEIARQIPECEKQIRIEEEQKNQK